MRVRIGSAANTRSANAEAISEDSPKHGSVPSVPIRLKVITLRLLPLHQGANRISKRCATGELVYVMALRRFAPNAESRIAIQQFFDGARTCVVKINNLSRYPNVAIHSGSKLSL